MKFLSWLLGVLILSSLGQLKAADAPTHREWTVDGVAREAMIYSPAKAKTEASPLNGGAFTYLLWAERGDLFAAFAPSAAVAFKQQAQLKPKPLLHVAGQNDTLVKFVWQEMTIKALQKLNQCGAGQPWEQKKDCTLYPSPLKAPLVTFIHSGTHQYPAEAPAIIVKFLKSQSLK